MRLKSLNANKKRRAAYMPMVFTLTYYLQTAVRNNQPDRVIELLDSSAKTRQIVNEEIFPLAAMLNRVDIVKLLLDNGVADIHWEHDIALRLACRNGNVELARVLITEYNANMYALNNSCAVYACEHAHADILVLLIESGLNPRRIDTCRQTSNPLIKQIVTV